MSSLHRRSVSRRTVLRGMGAGLALPYLESFGLANVGAASPERLLFVYVPNGMHTPDWRLPTDGQPESGPLPAQLPKTLAELERHRDQLCLTRGMTLDKARNNGDGPGDHARSSGAFLTCTQPVKADGTVLGVDVSVDQLAARALGQTTRFPSLQLACEGGMQAGQCDSGYPCAYSSNLSWSSPHTPLVPETSPRALFDRLFGIGLTHLDPEERARRVKLRKSVLDYVRNDARKLSGRLGSSDRRKLEEYLEGIRELELRIDRATDPVAVAMERPTGTPSDYAEHVSMMFELITLAFATDSTRVATFMLANEGSNRTYGDLGAREGHHSLSHHDGNAKKQEIIASINRFHARLFGEFLDRMQSTNEADGSLLSRTTIVYGSGIADGNSHDHGDIPLLVAGGAGSLPRGAQLAVPRETPVANLYLRILADLGVRDSDGMKALTRFGDSTGILAP